MAGIYVHIPFCKTRCAYCDFFSSISVRSAPEYVNALCKEIQLQKAYLQQEKVETVYFGGGTPSLLNASAFGKIFEELARAVSFGNDPEITLEANPDDLSPAYLDVLRMYPFNRISLGVQSFRDTDLRFLNRRHDAAGAIQAVQHGREAGYTNLSVDLMYGLPGQTLADWERTVEQALALGVQHISAYHLIYEEGTHLFRLLESGKIQAVSEELSVEMFSVLIDRLVSAGFVHYEISNFGLPGYFSRHNCSYWNGTYYLGLGAAAHSFNGNSRQWNIRSIGRYMEAISNGAVPAEKEIIDDRMAYNEVILTGLRTMWGVDLKRIKSCFGEDVLRYCLEQSQKYKANRQLIQEGNALKLSASGIFLSDGIMSDLLIAP